MSKTLFLLKEYYGNHVHLKAVKPYYVLSTDDTVQYVFKGKGLDQEKLLLLGALSNAHAGTRSQ